MNLEEELEKAGVEPSDLDELVRSAALDAASEANNGGLRKQCLFIKASIGMPEGEIFKAVTGREWFPEKSSG